MKAITIFALFVALLALLALAAGAVEPTLPGAFHKAWISGTVTCAGAPLAGVRVFAMSESGGRAEAMNAGNGNYSLGVGEGKWTVAAMKDGYYLTKMLDVTVKGEEARERADLVMKKSTAFIEGAVVDESGKGIGKAVVMAMPDMMAMAAGGEEVPESETTAGGAPAFHAQCDRDGRFRLQAMKGDYMLMAAAPGYELSPKNPRPKFPGMEDMPNMPEMPGMPVMGVQVAVAEGETKKGVVIILRPSRTAPSPRPEPVGGEEKLDAPPPKANVLVGRAQLTPNNVLHWTRVEQRDRDKSWGLYVVVRSTADFAGSEKGEVKTFDRVDSIIGTPADGYCSFTDSTAAPGVTYWYVVFERGSADDGPRSNSVRLTTR